MQTIIPNIKTDFNHGYKIWKKNYFRYLSYPAFYFIMVYIGGLLMDKIYVLHYLKINLPIINLPTASLINVAFAFIVMASFWETVIQIEDENKQPHFIKEFLVEDNIIGKMIILSLIIYFIYPFINYVVMYIPNHDMTFEDDYDYYNFYHKVSVFIFIISLIISTFIMFSPFIVVANSSSIKEAFIESKNIVANNFWYYMSVYFIASLFLWKPLEKILYLFYYIRMEMGYSNKYGDLFSTVYEILYYIIHPITWTILGCWIYALYENRILNYHKHIDNAIELIGEKEEE